MRIFNLLFIAGLSVFIAGCDTMGSFLAPTRGVTYDQVPALEGRAMLYIYRPSSSWAGGELEAPLVHVDGHRLGGIKNNGFMWISLIPGRHEIELTRAVGGVDNILGFHFYRLKTLTLEMEAGQYYYLRYNELQPAPYEALINPDESWQTPTQWVSRSFAEPELLDARKIRQGIFVDATTEPPLAELKGIRYVHPDGLPKPERTWLVLGDEKKQTQGALRQLKGIEWVEADE